MNEIKRNYNKVLAAKFRNIPKIIRKNNLTECKELTLSYKAQIENPKSTEVISETDTPAGSE
jgi:hypothetical protein